MLGIAYLTFPKFGEECGLLTPALMILVLGFASVMSTFLLIRVSHFHPECETYPDLVETVLGKGHSKILQIVILVYLFFSMTFFIYFSSLIVEDIYLKTIGMFPFTFLIMTAVKFVIAVLSWVIFHFEFKQVGILSYIANFCSLMVAVLLVIQLPSQHEAIIQDPRIKLFHFDLNSFRFVGNVFFAYTNQFSVIGLMKELRGQPVTLKYQVS